MKIRVTIDPSLEACTITHESVHLETPEDIAQWRMLLMSEMEAHVGNARMYLLIDFSGFSVSTLLANEYGSVAEELRERYAKDVFRYGGSDAQSFLSARLQSIKRAHRSNVFGTREQALEALKEARRAK